MNSHPSFQPFLRFVWQNSVFYRNLYLAHGIRERDLEKVSLQDLPIVTKQMMLANFDEIVTDSRLCDAAIEKWLEHDHDPRSRFLGEFLVLHSTGSSGKQANVVYDETGWQSMAAAAAGYLYPGKRTRGSRYRNAFYIGDRGHVASATTAVNLSPFAFDRLVVSLQDPIEETIAKLNAFQPDRLTSYSSSLGWLAELALAGKLKISPQDIVASADRLTPAVEKMIRQAWDPKIFDLYAATEALFIAIKQPGQSEWKVLDEIQTIEVLGDDDSQVRPGEIGRAVLTNYTNKILPFIRYDLSDYVIYGETQPGNTTLRGFIGRTFEKLPIRLNDGRIGEIPSHALAAMASASPDSFQFITISPDEVELHYCAREDLEESLRADMVVLLRKWGGENTRFRILRVDHIWDDAYALKYKLVRKPDDNQIGLPAFILSEPARKISSPKPRPSDGFVPFVREQMDCSIATLFERQVSRSPQAYALNDGELRLTYAEINRAANRVARALVAQRMDPSQPVVLLFKHKAAMITAMLGVLKAGGWYTPLDPEHPAARNAGILREVGAGLILTDAESLATAQTYGLSDEQIINLDELAGSLNEDNLCLTVEPGAPACVLYTSGSTGKPKGVVLDHRAVLHRIMLYTNDYAIGSSDRMSLLQSYVFSASVREIFAALLNGAGLYLYSLKRDGVHHLAEWLENEDITTLYMVPAVFRLFLETLKNEKFDQLRLIRLGGEAVLASDVSGFKRHFSPGCVLVNGLASTETGTSCQYFIDHQTWINGSRVPVGTSVQDKIVNLLDEDDHPVDNGLIGEIVVASDYLGPGYFPETGEGTGARLIAHANPQQVIHTGDLGICMPEGHIVVVGRKDWQVKLRGQRMNLLEIEQALLSLENVAEAAVLLQIGEDGADFLAAYIQPKILPAPKENNLRRELRTLLPGIMIPNVFKFLDSLPHTMSGKVDRLALSEVQSGSFGNQPLSQEPLETPTEMALAEIWCDLLGTDHVGADDAFFDLGGDSLQASALMANIEARFQHKIPLSDLFQHSTLRSLAAAIEQQDEAVLDSLLFTIQSKGEKAPVFFFSGIDGDVLTARALAVHLGKQHPLFGLRGMEYGGSAGNVKTIEQAADQYAGAILAANPHRTSILIGYSFGGHLALESARRIAAAGEPQPLVVMIDTYPAAPMPETTLARRARFHINNLRRFTSTHEVAGYFRDRLQRIYLRLIRHRMTRGFTQKIKAPDPSPVSAAQIALAAYQPEPYFGRVVLLQAGQREWFMDTDPMEAWQDVVHGELEIHTVPGEHLNLIKQPFVIELARQIIEVLDVYDPSQPFSS